MSGPVPALPARSLSDTEQQERAEKCFAIAQRLKTGLHAGRAAIWAVAQACAEFDDENGWTALGYDSMRQWLAEPDVGMSRATFMRLTRTYRELKKRQVPASRMAELEPSKVDIVLPKVRTGAVDLEKALSDAEELGSSDLRANYYDRPDPADEEPVHDDLDVLEGGSNVETTGEPEVELVDETHDNDLGGTAAMELWSCARQMHLVLQRVWTEVAPKDKKKMSGDLRDELGRVLDEANRVVLG
jgi:hypothetical protein